MQAPVNHIIGFAAIARERSLSVDGVVLARLNQKVSSGDVVAETTLAREHILLDVARILGVHPNAADRLVKCKVNDRLEAGAEIATGGGLFSRTVYAPRNGRVVAVGGGQVLMEANEIKIELKAGIPGLITEVYPNRGVAIQTTGALVQGVWGNGRIDSGPLANVVEKPDGILTPAHLDVSMRGSVMLGGIVKDAETLKAAAELPVRGLILSSLFPSLLQLAREMRYPIIATDGFGSIPMNSAAYKLLSTNVKRETVVNAEVYNRYTGSRPEVIIPLPVSASTEAPTLREAEPFAPGLQVRMRRPPAMGVIGSIVSVKPGMTTLPSGLRARTAEVKLENGEIVIAPLVNLEVVG